MQDISIVDIHRSILFKATTSAAKVFFQCVLSVLSRKHNGLKRQAVSSCTGVAHKRSKALNLRGGKCFFLLLLCEFVVI